MTNCGHSNHWQKNVATAPRLRCHNGSGELGAVFARTLSHEIQPRGTSFNSSYCGGRQTHGHGGCRCPLWGGHTSLGGLCTAYDRVTDHRLKRVQANSKNTRKKSTSSSGNDEKLSVRGLYCSPHPQRGSPVPFGGKRAARRSPIGMDALFPHQSPLTTTSRRSPFAGSS